MRCVLFACVCACGCGYVVGFELVHMYPGRRRHSTKPIWLSQQALLRAPTHTSTLFLFFSRKTWSVPSHALMIGNSKSNHLGAQDTFNPNELPVSLLARRRERMILHALAIQIRAELRVRLSLNAASYRLTPLASYSFLV